MSEAGLKKRPYLPGPVMIRGDVTDGEELTKRSWNFEIRAFQEGKGGEGTSSVIEGRPIVYDSKTDMGYMFETIEKGALDGADLTDVRFLINHDLGKLPLARYREGFKDSTMLLSIDDKGLVIKVYLDTENNSDARNLYSAVSRGDVTGMSFMFVIGAHGWEDLESDKPTHRISRISLVLEVSAVTFPAYEDTEIYARDKGALDNARRAMKSEKERAEKAAKAAGETCAARTLLKMYGGKGTC